MTGSCSAKSIVAVLSFVCLAISAAELTPTTVDISSVAVLSTVAFGCKTNSVWPIRWNYYSPTAVEPTILYNGQALNPHLRSRITVNSSNVTMQSDLIIAVVQHSDAGKYSCIVSSVGGQLKHDFKLFVVDEPDDRKQPHLLTTYIIVTQNGSLQSTQGQSEADGDRVTTTSSRNSESHNGTNQILYGVTIVCLMITVVFATLVIRGYMKRNGSSRGGPAGSMPDVAESQTNNALSAAYVTYDIPKGTSYEELNEMMLELPPQPSHYDELTIANTIITGSDDYVDVKRISNKSSSLSIS